MGASRSVNRIAILAIACVVGVGCTSGADDTGSPATNSPRGSNVPPPPEIGQCRNTPARNQVNDRFDDTPVVSCARTHTLETVDVIEPTEKLTPSLAKQLADNCGAAVWNYLNGVQHTFYKLVPVYYSPSPEQRAAGQSWVRCDVGVQARWGVYPPVEPQHTSLHNALGEDPARFRVCISELPDPDRNQPLVSCKQPHRAELLSDRLTFNTSRYPTAALLQKHGRSGCARTIAGRDDIEELQTTPDWESEENWDPSRPVYGWCWLYRKTGLLPPLR